MEEIRMKPPHPPGYLSYGALSFRRQITCCVCKVQIETLGKARYCPDCRKATHPQRKRAANRRFYKRNRGKG